MEAPRKSRERATRQIWLDAAYDLFVNEGIEAVKIMALAKKLDLTRTGFYWHFKDLGALHAAIIDIWQTRNTGIMIERCALPANSLCAALFNLVDCWIDPDLFDAPLDLAVRNWARNDVVLQKLVDRSDEKRITAVQSVFQRFGIAPDVAHYRAMTAVLTQTGYYSMRITEPRLQRAVSATRYVAIFAGEQPTKQEVDDFLARHNDEN
ncbi:MAG: TetR/AcrR family transcriptional regulator [Pseudomonadota bacterium]